MEITFMNNMPRRRNRHAANVTSAGYLYFNGRLADTLQIDDNKRYKLAVIYNRGEYLPALVEDPEGNKISKQHKGFVIYIKSLKERFGLADNEKLSIKKINTKKTKGFFLLKEK